MELEAWLDQTREQALEPSLPLVDAHHHLWDATAVAKKRAYLDGVIDENTAPTKDGSIRLDAEAFNSGDAETLGLLCPVSDDTLLYVASQWNDRNLHAESHYD